MPPSAESGAEETAPAPIGGWRAFPQPSHNHSEDVTLARRPIAVGQPFGAAAQTEEILTPGTLVDRFQVRRLLGSGGMGQVYLATDTVLGRQVALKVLKPGSGSARHTDVLLAEAQVTATFNHPNIIHIYHAGIIGGAPYLALEYVPGETLAERLKQKRFSPMEAVRVGLAITSALEESHGCGILHRDLKPGNVMIGTDGRIRVLDFGMAQPAGRPADGAERDIPSATVVGGTPAYMAPELWTGQTPTETSDMWALGLILAELTTGKHPFRDPEKPQQLWTVDIKNVPDWGLDTHMPEPLSRLITDCLAVDPTLRPTARDARHRLETLLAKPNMVSGDQSPFRGLSAFDQRHAHLFFGRENDITSLVEHLRDHVVTPVVGASGAGKSSLVFAGVLPRLLEQGSWQFVRLRPGEFPLQTLAKRVVEGQAAVNLEESETDNDQVGTGRARVIVSTTPQQIADFVDQLRTTPAVLGLRLQQMADHWRGPVALVVDGLEEVFTTGPDDEDRRVFLEALCSVDPDPALSYRIIITLREDFLGKFAAFGAARHVLSNLVMVTIPQAAELEKAVRAPVETLGYRFDDEGLPQEMVNQIKDEPNALPLLQYTAHQLWERRDPERKLLLRRVYDELGGVAGALAQKADGILASFLPAEVDVAKTLLLRLVTPRGTRANLPTDRVIDGLGPASERVVARLVEARLLALRRSPDRDGTPRLELAHETLIQSWRTLATWIADSHEGIKTLAEVNTAAELWDGRTRAPEFLWADKGLSELMAKLNASGLKIPALTLEFLNTSQRRQNRRRRIRRAIVGTGITILICVAVMSSLIAAFIHEQKTEAQQQRDEAERQREIVVEQSLRIDKARRDLGRFRLVLMPFDWDGVSQTKTAVNATQLPDLSWTLYDPKPTVPSEPDLPVSNDRITRRQQQHGPARVDWVETAAGPRILRIDGRGRAGETCSPTWISLRWLPGYAESEDSEVTEIVVPFPTCAATWAGMVKVPGGPVWSRLVQPENVADGGGNVEFQKREVETFWIDKTEVTNGSYAAFAELEENTGYGLPKLPEIDEYRGTNGPDYPVSFVDWHEAQTFCRYWGKELPTEVQWEKAARGGWTLDEAQQQLNPMPKRRFPWGDDPAVGRANLAGLDDGYQVHASVFAFAENVGPYGTLNQAGNVSEWIRSELLTLESYDLRFLVGGDWATDLSRPWPEIGQLNTRHPRALNYTTGFRCAVSQGGKSKQ